MLITYFRDSPGCEHSDYIKVTLLIINVIVSKVIIYSQDIVYTLYLVLFLIFNNLKVSTNEERPRFVIGFGFSPNFVALLMFGLRI